MEEETEKALVVVELIEKVTNSTAGEVDPRILRAIKSAVRSSDSEIRVAKQTLLALMKRDHAQVRYLALLIIDELFMRSKLFRTLVVENLDQLLSLSVGFRRNLPLPAPASVASVLRSKAIEFLEKWNVSFGVHYRQLRLGYEYLKNTLRFQFPNLQANAARFEQERRERATRTKEILLKKFESLKLNICSIKEEIQSTIDEIGECLDILKTKDDDIALTTTVDGEEFEEFRNSELRQIRLDSLREGENVQENSENKIVFDALRELYKILLTKHHSGVQESISVLIRAEVEVADNNRFRDSALKDFIDIRNIIQATKRKCEESGCALPKIVNNEEQDIWEEGNVPPALENGNPGPSCSGSTQDDSNTRCSTKFSNLSMRKSHEINQSESDPSRSKLLADAPVLNWGSFLDNWGSNQDVLANQRGLELESHWGRVDQDAVIPAQKIAELNVRVSVYEEETVEIQPCRVPLKKGGLCERRDLRICPFHGLIIPRDDEGKPINDSALVENQSAETAQDLDTTNVVERLLEQSVKNVEERDKAESKKREFEKQTLKRAKLAKVREHNETVLRDAAIASTSRSSHIGEEDVGLGGVYVSTKSKKQTLSSMLKKKETTKARLAQRLLNSRARDSTLRQLAEAEDASYREAFPNQW